LKENEKYPMTDRPEPERVVELDLGTLHPFQNHPFKVREDEAMMDTAESIRRYGVLVPAIARPDPAGGYELIAGHRRHYASVLAGKKTIPVIVRDLDDDAATILMVDSNLQREELLPSERAFAYKMKLEAMKHQGERSDLTSSQVGTKLRTDQILASQVGKSRNQVQRYIRLTELIPPLLDMVDERKIAIGPAYELSFLKPEEQEQLVETMDKGLLSQMLSLPEERRKDLKLNGEHILFVLNCLQENTTKVRNIKQYFLTVLYNAPVTISNYYTARVNHDLYGDDTVEGGRDG
jgi:ParB family chromosome partitioning protein